MVVKVACQPKASKRVAMPGATTAAPIPPDAHSSPVANPRRCLNHPLTEANIGTIASDWVIDKSTPKYMKNCQRWVTDPIRDMLTKYNTPQANMRGLAP